MSRRSTVAGISSLTLGFGMIIGTGAFTVGPSGRRGRRWASVQTVREEPSGRRRRENSLRLDAINRHTVDTDLIIADDDGRLRAIAIDGSRSAGEGVNTSGITLLGNASDDGFPNPDDGDLVAFLVINDGDGVVDLSATVSGPRPNVLSFPSFVRARHTVIGRQQLDLTLNAIEGLMPGGAVFVTVSVDTTDIPETGRAVDLVSFVSRPRAGIDEAE